MTNIDKLMDAIKRRDIEEIKIILDEDGALVNAYDETGATALHYAAFDGFREIVRLLLDRGAEINSLVPHQRVGPSSICESGAASLASS